MRMDRRTDEFEERIIEINRTSKKTKGGNTMSFAALVVVGNRNGKVGTGYAKAREVAIAVSKALAKARKDMIDVKIKGTTIAHEVSDKYGSAKVFMKPAPKGSGIIAGGSVRVVLELAGIHDISSK
ncbi:30S ribosomal protein S5, partial [candidate division WWE3 bacterium RBG_13_37_7]